MTTRMNGLYITAFALALSLAPNQARAQAQCVNINASAATVVQATQQQLIIMNTLVASFAQLITNPGASTPQDLLAALAASTANTAAQASLLPQLSDQLGPAAVSNLTNILGQSNSMVGGLASLLNTLLLAPPLPLPGIPGIPIPTIPGLPFPIPSIPSLPLPATLPLPYPFDPSTLAAVRAQLAAIQSALVSTIPTICQ